MAIHLIPSHHITTRMCESAVGACLPRPGQTQEEWRSAERPSGVACFLPWHPPSSGWLVMVLGSISGAEAKDRRREARGERQEARGERRGLRDATKYATSNECPPGVLPLVPEIRKRCYPPPPGPHGFFLYSRSAMGGPRQKNSAATCNNNRSCPVRPREQITSVPLPSNRRPRSIGLTKCRRRVVARTGKWAVWRPVRTHARLSSVSSLVCLYIHTSSTWPSEQ